MKNKTTVKSADEFNSTHSILGTYEGECADANITNNNGLDITREVWENVFNSDDYKEAIEHGWYIGYLGHPEDPNCMEFKDACIVMTEGSIDDKGKIQGKFNLIDTPVGRVVKAFQDAGVTFGISVRGAGDIVDNSVDPDTFVFRGFDLVTFPAYPESIPTFTALAASTDLDKQKKYKILCSTVKENIKKIEDESVLSTIQSQFAKQSEVYAEIESKKQSLNEMIDEPDESFIQAKLEAMTNLYLDAISANTQLKKENAELRGIVASTKLSSEKRLSSIKKIMASQQNDLQDELDDRESKISECNRKIEATTKIVSNLKSKLQASEKLNLKYKQKIESSTDLMKSKDSVISSLRDELNETVNVVTSTKTRSSNLDAVNKKLRDDIKCARELLSQYQEAYANLYATALGIKCDSIPVTATTSVKDLQNILGSINTSNVGAILSDEIEELDVEDVDPDGIVSI